MTVEPPPPTLLEILGYLASSLTDILLSLTKLHLSPKRVTITFVNFAASGLTSNFPRWIIYNSPTGRHFAYCTVRLLDVSSTRHFTYYLDSSPTDCSFLQQDYQNKIKGQCYTPEFRGRTFVNRLCPQKFRGPFFVYLLCPRILGVQFRKSTMPQILWQCDIFYPPDGDT